MLALLYDRDGQLFKEVNVLNFVQMLIWQDSRVQPQPRIFKFNGFQSTMRVYLETTFEYIEP